MSHYDTLGVQKEATASEIRAAYRKKAGECHPDREGGNVELMAQINRANDCLSNDDARKRYDESGFDGIAVTLEQEARDELIKCFMDWTAFDNPTPCVKFIENGLSETIKMLSNRLVELELLCERKKKLRSKLKLKPSATAADNIFEGVIDEQLVGIEKNMVSIQHQIEVFERVIEMAHDYEQIIDVGVVKNNPEMLNTHTYRLIP